jgi:hypothetical protein
MTFVMHVFQDPILPKLGKVYGGIITMVANVYITKKKDYSRIKTYNVISSKETGKNMNSA